MKMSTPLSVGFERRLKAMERDGQLLRNPGGQLLINSKSDFVAGRVQGHRDGFGLLLREAGGPDLFLPPSEMLNVLPAARLLAKQAGPYSGHHAAGIFVVGERRT